MNKFTVRCSACGRTTSRKYARLNGGKCKPCVTGVENPPRSSSAERENALLIDSGYQAYARERGDYDLPDSY